MYQYDDALIAPRNRRMSAICRAQALDQLKPAATIRHRCNRATTLLLPSKRQYCIMQLCRKLDTPTLGKQSAMLEGIGL